MNTHPFFSLQDAINNQDTVSGEIRIRGFDPFNINIVQGLDNRTFVLYNGNYHTSTGVLYESALCPDTTFSSQM
jgi:hypothetical protein